ncbi:helix-turn-helix domain-containing protein [Streptomyces antibioticus]|uniref:DNA-binding protein n=1 Tax=Streptomyces antibioticus TaxID=1890 RepID=A0AAE7CLR3_STRAT|nr:helix-turn-helix transcriptional regulator [Streptomyces antibioticus]OOQ50405.1 DNA-binding protein [Streptomyces antibioticus]QIT45831.1 helix-turn-helix domain-containing protein [Streptomyces antibioticus]
MARRTQVTARQERLGAELRKLREAAGLKGREAASLLGTDAGRLSQIESGVAGVSEETVRRLVAHYACTDAALIEALVAMATERVRGWWHGYRGKLPTAFLDLSELEHHATHYWDVSFLHIPGLLQTEAYARQILGYRVPELPSAELELRVRHRLDRHVILERAIPYTAVIHEAALRIRVGDRAAARTQLDHVLDLSERDHITVRVIPFDLDRFAGADSAMVYVGGTVPKLDTVVRDGPHGTAFIDSEAQLGRFRTLFRRMEGVSLDPERSRAFVHQLAKEM